MSYTIVSFLSVPVFQGDWERRDTRPALQWPQNGAVQFDNYSTRYRPGMDLVLKHITCNVSPSEKVSVRQGLHLNYEKCTFWKPL